MSRALVVACLAVAPVGLAAQDAGQPAAKPAAKAEFNSPSKWDIFAGYSYLAPKGTVNTPSPVVGAPPIPLSYKSDTAGFILSGARYVNDHVGGQIEAATHETFRNSSSTNDGFTTIQVGPIFRFPMDEITPFIHGLVGVARVGGPNLDAAAIGHYYTWGVALTAGGGMDYQTPLFNHHLAIRLFQADFEYMHANFGTGFGTGGRANIKAARLSAGLVFHVGTIAPPPQLTVACAVNPTSVFPGESVNVTATVGSQDPKANVVYSITGDGVKANGATATVDTADLAPGQHTVKCDAKEGKPGKEGLKPWQVATEATASFTVKEFEPPTISCSANPTTLKPGDSSTITATAMSPQNRPLTYSYSASGGTVNGNGATATYSSTGAPTGPVTLTCNVSDDKRHNASATTNVTIEAPPPPPQPHAQALCSINFTTDKARPMRVDNEAKACLDEVALDLQKQADAKVVVVGESNAKEKALQEKQEKYAARHKHAKVENFAAQRAVNAKEYLVTDKGIDGSRISAATGSGDDQKVENYLVPAGADFNTDVSGTTPVDESQYKPQVRKDLPQRHHHKHATKKTAQ
jgi:hypothetical protein